MGMPACIRKFAERTYVSLMAKNEVARFDGIVICDPQENKTFCEATVAALKLIKDLDPRRFRRIQRSIKWIVNVLLPHGGARYSYSSRICKIDFEKAWWDAWAEQATDRYAAVLVHEATHGVVQAKNIPYSPELRSRIERLCVREEERFLARHHQTTPASTVHGLQKFDESSWHILWNESLLQNFVALVQRLCRDKQDNRAARRLNQR